MYCSIHSMIYKTDPFLKTSYNINYKHDWLFLGHVVRSYIKNTISAAQQSNFLRHLGYIIYLHSSPPIVKLSIPKTIIK